MNKLSVAPLFVGLLLAFTASGEERVDHYSGDDSYTDFDLEFDFPLYGETMTTSRMYTNGVVEFGNDDEPLGPGHYCCNGEEYGTSGWHQNQYDASYTIMPLWTDLIDNTSAGTQYTISNTDSMVYGWENLREYSTTNLNTFDLTVYSSGNWAVNYDDVNITRHGVSVGSIGDYATGEWDQYLYQQGSYYSGTGTDINDVNGYTGYTGVVDTASESDGVCVGDASDVDCQTESIAMAEETMISYAEDEEVIEVAAVSSTVTEEWFTETDEEVEEEPEEEAEETEEEAEPEPEQETEVEAEAEVETEVAEVEVETEVETETVEMEVVELVQPVVNSFTPTFQIKEVVDMGSYEVELIEQVAMVEQTEDWYADGGGYSDDGMEDSGLLAGYNNSIQDNGEWY